MEKKSFFLKLLLSHFLKIIIKFILLRFNEWSVHLINYCFIFYFIRKGIISNRENLKRIFQRIGLWFRELDSSESKYWIKETRILPFDSCSRCSRFAGQVPSRRNVERTLQNPCVWSLIAVVVLFSRPGKFPKKEKKSKG